MWKRANSSVVHEWCEQTKSTTKPSKSGNRHFTSAGVTYPPGCCRPGSSTRTGFVLHVASRARSLCQLPSSIHLCNFLVDYLCFASANHSSCYKIFLTVSPQNMIKKPKLSLPNNIHQISPLTSQS